MPRPRPVTSIAGAAVALALTLSAPAAHAQLRGLGRAVGGAVAERVVGSQIEQRTGAAAGERPAARSYTTDDLDRFIAAVGPAGEQAQARAAWRASMDQYKQRNDERTQCFQRLAATLRAPDPNMDQAAMDRIDAAMQAQSARLSSARTDAERGAASDSVMALQEAMQVLMFPQLKQCGARPASPGMEPPMDDAGVAQRAKAAGFTTSAFGLLRERIGAYVVAGSTAGLTDESKAAFDARAAQLQGLRPYLTNVSWQTWGDLQW